MESADILNSGLVRRLQSVRDYRSNRCLVAGNTYHSMQRPYGLSRESE